MGFVRAKICPPSYFPSIYDLEQGFHQNKANGVSCETNDNRLYAYLKIFIILFADDTVLFSNTKEDLQYMLNIFEQYCRTWKLTVNISKTKILVLVLEDTLETITFIIME